MYDIQIQNIVASSAIAKAIDLYAIDDKFENTDYDPKTFPGLVYRLKEPKTSVLIFRSGKIVSTGAKTLEEVDRCVAKVVDDLKKAGFDVFDDAKAEVFYNGVWAYRRGNIADEKQLAKLAAVMKKDAFEVVVDLHLGRHEASIYTCDFSTEYVHINADYTT